MNSKDGTVCKVTHSSERSGRPNTGESQDEDSEAREVAGELHCGREVLLRSAGGEDEFVLSRGESTVFVFYTSSTHKSSEHQSILDHAFVLSSRFGPSRQSSSADDVKYTSWY